MMCGLENYADRYCRHAWPDADENWRRCFPLRGCSLSVFGVPSLPLCFSASVLIGLVILLHSMIVLTDNDLCCQRGDWHALQWLWLLALFLPVVLYYPAMPSSLYNVVWPLFNEELWMLTFHQQAYHGDDMVIYAPNCSREFFRRKNFVEDTRVVKMTSDAFSDLNENYQLIWPSKDFEKNDLTVAPPIRITSSRSLSRTLVWQNATYHLVYTLTSLEELLNRREWRTSGSLERLYFLLPLVSFNDLFTDPIHWGSCGGVKKRPLYSICRVCNQNVDGKKDLYPVYGWKSTVTVYRVGKFLLSFPCWFVIIFKGNTIFSYIKVGICLHGSGKKGSYFNLGGFHVAILPNSDG